MKTLHEFKERLAAIADRKAVSEHMTLKEMGIDSLRALEVILLLQEISNNTLDPDVLELTELTTVDELFAMAIPK